MKRGAVVHGRDCNGALTLKAGAKRWPRKQSVLAQVAGARQTVKLTLTASRAEGAQAEAVA